jgi:hypothetical protein
MAFSFSALFASSDHIPGKAFGQNCEENSRRASGTILIKSGSSGSSSAVVTYLTMAARKMSGAKKSAHAAKHTAKRAVRKKTGTKRPPAKKTATTKEPLVALKKIPNTENSLVLRTDFADEAAWKALGAAIQRPVGDFQARVSLLSDRVYEGATVEQIIASAADHAFVFIADRSALKDPAHPVLVVDLEDEPGRSFRVIPSEAWSVENNLSLANMGFDEFADAVDEDGVFRGFSDG